MKAVVTGARSWSLGGADVSLDALPDLGCGLAFLTAPDPARPDAVPVGSWRRFSRLARLGAACAGPLVQGRTDLDSLALFWGTGIGEFTSSAAFLRSLFIKGPAGASPLSFQNSVHNAGAGHLSIAYGMRGPSETVCAGPETAARVLERALCWVAARRRPALVVVSDDLGADIQAGYTYAGITAPCSEGAAALLLSPEGVGPELRLVDGAPCADDWRRWYAWPEETREMAGRSYDVRLGLYPAADLVAVASCVHAGSGAVALGDLRVVIG